jgi:hypothetical protein
MRPLRAVFKVFGKFFLLLTSGCNNLLGPTPFVVKGHVPLEFLAKFRHSYLLNLRVDNQENDGTTAGKYKG